MRAPPSWKMQKMLTLSETVDEKGTIWFLAAGAVRAGGRKGGLTEFVLARLLVSEINTEQRERVGAAELSNEYVTTTATYILLY